jgi:cell division protein FtsW (lipid II flippase)
MRNEETAARPRSGPSPSSGVATAGAPTALPFDGLLLAAILGLAAVGAVMVYSASAIPAGQSRRLGFDEFYYLKRQVVAAGIGIGLMALAHPWLQLHPVNREEVERVLAKLTTLGAASLTADERAFLDRFSGI